MGVGDCLPTVSLVFGTVDLAPQTESQQMVPGAGQQAEQSAVGRDLDATKVLALVGRTQQQALLGGDEQGALQIENTVEVQGRRVVQTLADGPPMLAAIQGLECQAIGADDEAVLIIEKVHGQEGFVRSVFQ
ncbi:hypothetical protein D3C80_940060 [compost metagenome]